MGDRLLTQGQPGAASTWDPYANKTILVLAQNGTVIVSYAGLAHIQSKPTDQWLAEAIVGATFRPGIHGGLATGFGGSFKVTMAEVMSAIPIAMKADLPREPKRDRSHGLQVLISGWTWKRRAKWGGRLPRPILLTFRHSGTRGVDATLEELPRAWRWDRTMTLGHIGVGIGAHKPQLLSDLGAPNLIRTDKDIESMLVRFIRSTSESPLGDVVGTECMAVSVSRAQEVRVRFHRDSALTNPQTAFTPIVLGRGIMLPPSVLTGPGFYIGAGGFEIPVESLPPLPVLGTDSLRGQYRRPYP